MERKTGLLRCYTSRVENGHTIPSIETLEKMARSLEVPLYQLFYDGSEKPPILKMNDTSGGKDSQTLRRFRTLLSRTDERDLKLLLFIAQRMSQKKNRRTKTK